MDKREMRNRILNLEDKLNLLYTTLGYKYQQAGLEFHSASIVKVTKSKKE